ncbi:MAG: OsmC family protein [Desulfovibrionaceae bacterium]|nr:OsmC family protein [Desulfovibrionaceae bacterium]
MPEKSTVTLVQEGDIITIDTGSPYLEQIVMDFTDEAEEDRRGYATSLLLSSAACCYTGNLRAALMARGVPFRKLTTRVVGTKDRNRTGAPRVVGIDIEVAVDCDAEYQEQIDHCAKVARHCMITASLVESIPVTGRVIRSGE